MAKPACEFGTTLGVAALLADWLQGVAFHAEDFLDQIPIQGGILLLHRHLPILLTAVPACVQPTRGWVTDLAASGVVRASQNGRSGPIEKRRGELRRRKQWDRQLVGRESGVGRITAPDQLNGTILPFLPVRRGRRHPPSASRVSGGRRRSFVAHRLQLPLALHLALVDRITQALDGGTLLYSRKAGIGCNDPNKIFELFLRRRFRYLVVILLLARIGGGSSFRCTCISTTRSGEVGLAKALTSRDASRAQSPRRRCVARNERTSAAGWIAIAAIF